MLFAGGRAAAQTSTTLVSTIGQSDSSFVKRSFAWDQAQAFTTGANSNGYKLTEVKIDLKSGSGATTPAYTVSIRSDSSGSPGSTLTGGTLTNPASLTTGSNTFSASGTGIDLAANTTYFVVLDASGAGTHEIALTDSDSEDSGVATGWSIANMASRRNHSSSGSWSQVTQVRKIAIAGYAKTASTPPPQPPPPPPPPVITSSEGVTYSGNAQEGFSLSPLGEGGSIVYGGRTIDIPVTRDECQSPDNPAVIIPRNVLDRVREITFELSVSPQDSPPGFRVEGCTADIDPGVTLGQTETVTVCLPPSEVQGKSYVHRYDEVSGEWERLPSRIETVNEEELVCGKTDTFSLFGVFLPVIESAEGVSYSEDAENGFSLTPLGVGGSIVYGEKTIDLSVTGDVASRDPAVIVPRNVLDRVNGITFELSGVSPHDPPPGLRLSGFTAEVNLGVTLGEGETVGVCFPSAGGDIYRYAEASGEWELLESREEMVNGEEVLCAETGAVSLTGVFVEETGGCAVAAASKEGTVRWQGAVLNLLLVISVLLLAAKPGVYGRDAASG